MIVNIILLAFLVFMAYWWMSQGLFSGLLHLVAVIVAGSLALALWEPISLGLLMKWDKCAPYAWGLGLGIPFVALLLIVRYGFDKLIGKNINFNPIVSMVGGAALGLLAGVLTAGLGVISVNYLPAGVAFGGYQPLQIDGNGKISTNPDGDLWFAVDSAAAGFFSKLSAGAFASDTPLRDFQPDLAGRAALHRLHLDESASLVAVPGTVAINTVYWARTPVTGLGPDQKIVLGTKAAAPGSRAVIVDTTWTTTRPGTFDSDQKVRIASTQIRLMTKPDGDDDSATLLHAPIAAARKNANDAGRALVAFDDDKTCAVGTNQNEQFGWVFVIPDTERLTGIMVRQLRLPLTAPEDDHFALGNALGAAGADAAPPPPDTLGPQQGHTPGAKAQGIEVTNKLPYELAPSAVPVSLTKNDDGEIMGGKGFVRQPVDHVSKAVDRIHIPSPASKALVRVEMTEDRARSLMGAAIATAVAVHGAFLRDSNQNQWAPIGYVWLHGDGGQDIVVDFDAPIQSSKNLPVRKMKSRDTLYLYYLVNRGVMIEEFHIGPTTQSVNLYVE